MAMGDNFIEKLLSDREGRKLYFREDLIFEVTEAICKTMEEKGISKAELSRMAGVSKSNITQLLSGDHNMRLTTVADLLFSLDSRLEVTAGPIEMDTVFDGITFARQEDWVLVGEFTAESFDYPRTDEKETEELAQAA
jgi:transcriptional regulator with XRE-family HTH domain